MNTLLGLDTMKEGKEVVAEKAWFRSLENDICIGSVPRVRSLESFI